MRATKTSACTRANPFYVKKSVAKISIKHGIIISFLYFWMHSITKSQISVAYLTEQTSLLQPKTMHIYIIIAFSTLKNKRNNQSFWKDSHFYRLQFFQKNWITWHLCPFIQMNWTPAFCSHQTSGIMSRCVTLPLKSRRTEHIPKNKNAYKSV